MFAKLWTVATFVLSMQTVFDFLTGQIQFYISVSLADTPRSSLLDIDKQVPKITKFKRTEGKLN